MTDKTPKILVDLYAEIAALTAPRCGSAETCRGYSRTVNRCCDPLYCDLAQEIAVANGVTLEPTGHPTLKFMGEKGCIVPPHLRPLCAMHDCKINSIGYDHKDRDFSEKFLALYKKINTEEFNRHKKEKENGKS